MKFIYNEKGFLLPNSPRSCALYHAKVDEKGGYMFRLHDCNTGVRLRGNINDQTEREEAIRKLQRLAQAATGLAGAIENLMCSVDKSIENSCRERLMTTRPNDTQKPLLHRGACEPDFQALFSPSQAANKRPLGLNTRRRKAVVELLHQQIRDVNRLVHVQDQSTPIRSRKCDPRLVGDLICQVKRLTSILDAYVFPLLEQTDNNKY